MLDKTSGIAFEEFGSVYNEPFNSDGTHYIRTESSIIDTTISHLLCFNCEIKIELVNGMADIIIGASKDHEALKVFSVHRYLSIKPDMYFNLIPVSDDVRCMLIIPDDYILYNEYLDPPFVYNQIVSRISVKEIIGYYYVIKNPGYLFKGETHNYYELTFVDHGILDTSVESMDFTLKNYDYLFYAPRQFHTQQVTADSSCSYLTIIFEMDIDDDAGLINRVFHCDNETYSVMRKFVSTSSSSKPYTNVLLFCYLEEFIALSLRQEQSKDSSAAAVTSDSMQHFQDELLKQILDYMDETVNESITISEVCSKFSVSRSFLQTLFKKNMDTTPKNYMIQLKLKRSKELIAENKYTISEISLMLGFSSIHYFSRTFKQHFDISPGEYAKKIYKN